ncbi:MULTISPECIES: hypothetical protein [Rhodomicrobium]|uniref:hypothetical protein n=1 Tax=Rhodomicrobium TaxID=1068 RepID=UPI001124D171|nr:MULTISPECIES: hypothetical protein [Rhodomicrobium]
MLRAIGLIIEKSDRWLRCNRPQAWHLQIHLAVFIFIITTLCMSGVAIFIPVRESSVPLLPGWLAPACLISLLVSVCVLSRYIRPLIPEQTRCYNREPLLIFSVIVICLINLPTLMSGLILKQRILALNTSALEALLAREINNEYYLLLFRQKQIEVLQRDETRWGRELRLDDQSWGGNILRAWHARLENYEKRRF